MAKYIQKPVIVDAIKWTQENYFAIHDLIVSGHWNRPSDDGSTWVIKDSKGKLSMVSDEEFQKLYEEVE